MRRREFITLLGGAAAWTPAAAARRPSRLVIGYLSARGPGNSADIIAAFRQGLKEAGFIEGETFTIRISFAEGDFDRLPALAADLVARKANTVVATGGTVSVVKAKPFRRQSRSSSRWVAYRQSRSCRKPQPTGRKYHGRCLSGQWFSRQADGIAAHAGAHDRCDRFSGKSKGSERRDQLEGCPSCGRLVGAKGSRRGGQYRKRNRGNSCKLCSQHVGALFVRGKT